MFGLHNRRNYTPRSKRRNASNASCNEAYGDSAILVAKLQSRERTERRVGLEEQKVEKRELERRH